MIVAAFDCFACFEVGLLSSFDYGYDDSLGLFWICYFVCCLSWFALLFEFVDFLILLVLCLMLIRLVAGLLFVGVGLVWFVAGLVVWFLVLRLFCAYRTLRLLVFALGLGCLTCFVNC